MEFASLSVFLKVNFGMNMKPLYVSLMIKLS